MDQLEGVAGAASDARLAGMAGAVQRFAALGPGRAGAAGAERSGGETRARSGLSSGRVAGLIGAAQRNIHGA